MGLAPPRVPDEMADAERREILALVPRSEASDGAATFVLPDFSSDPERFGCHFSRHLAGDRFAEEGGEGAIAQRASIRPGVPPS